MKKILVLVLALAMAICACSFAAAEEDELYIGILAPATTHGWVGGVTFFAEEAAIEAGVKYTMVTGSNAEEMASGMEQLVTLGVDGIVVWPQFEGVGAKAEEALDAGIVVYNFDMMLDMSEEYFNNENYYFLSGDNYGMGVAGAQYIVEKIGTSGIVLLMDVPGSGNVAADRMAGFKDTMAELAPDMEFVEIATAFAREDGLKDMADALTANEHIDAVFSMDDETSIGALQAIIEAGRSDIKAITGGGGCQEYFNMMDDEEYAGIWVSSSTYLPNMISTCVANMISVLSGEEVDHLIVDPTNVVDRDNVVDFLNEDTPY